MMHQRKACLGLALLLSSGVCLLVTENVGAASNHTRDHMVDAGNDKEGEALLGYTKVNNTEKSVINPDTLFTRRNGGINSVDRGIFTKDESSNIGDRIRRPVYPPSQYGYYGHSSSKKGKGKSKKGSSKSSGRPGHPYRPIVGGIFSRPNGGLKGGSAPPVTGKGGKQMKVKLAHFSMRITGDQLDNDELLETLGSYLLTEMGKDFRTLSAIELEQIWHFFGGTAFVGFVSKEDVIDSQIDALRDCQSLQAAMDRNKKIANGPAVVNGIYIDVTPPLPPILCSRVPPVKPPIPQPTVAPPVVPPVVIPPTVQPTTDPTSPPVTLPPVTTPVATPTLPPVATPATPTLPSMIPTQAPTLPPTRPPVPTTSSSPPSPPVGMASDFDRACTEGASFLYLPSEVSEVDCTCSRQEADILCTRPNSRSISCFGGSIEACAESYERWVFAPADGTLEAIEVCRDCLGSDCDEQSLSRNECLRLEYAGSDVTGCAVLRTFDAPPPAVLPECGSCSLCNAAQFDDPGIIHTCPGYQGRPDQGFLVDPNMCHSISLDVLFNVGFRFPRTYGELPSNPPPGDAPTVAPGCCAGNVEPCDFFTSEAGCFSQAGCAFGFGICFGEAEPCETFENSLEACNDQGGCRWTCS